MTDTRTEKRVAVIAMLNELVWGPMRPVSYGPFGSNDRVAYKLALYQMAETAYPNKPVPLSIQDHIRYNL